MNQYRALGSFLDHRKKRKLEAQLKDLDHDALLNNAICFLSNALLPQFDSLRSQSQNNDPASEDDIEPPKEKG